MGSVGTSVFVGLLPVDIGVVGDRFAIIACEDQNTVSVSCAAFVSPQIRLTLR